MIHLPRRLYVIYSPKGRGNERRIAPLLRLTPFRKEKLHVALLSNIEINVYLFFISITIYRNYF